MKYNYLLVLCMYYEINLRKKLSIWEINEATIRLGIPYEYSYSTVGVLKTVNCDMSYPIINNRSINKREDSLCNTMQF